MNKRHFLKIAGLATAAAAGSAVAETSMPNSNCTINENPATFVLVHGGQVGGWHFSKIAKILIAQGHTVYRPSLPGCAEHSHLIGPNTNLTSHITDIKNLIEIEQLNNIVLAGHSYGGMVITGAADQIPKKISSLVYLNGLLPEDGEGTVDLMRGDGIRAGMQALFDSGVHSLEPAPSSPLALDFGKNDDPSRYTAHPLATFLEPVSLTGAYNAIPKKTFIWSSQSPISESTKGWYDKTKALGWRTEVYKGNHNIHLDDTELCVDMLLRAI